MHIRRGDLGVKVNKSIYYYYYYGIQFYYFNEKEVKIGADKILENLKYINGSSIIPAGSLVYISTDDPDGICYGCLVKKIPCYNYSIPRPVGCPDDVIIINIISIKLVQ